MRRAASRIFAERKPPGRRSSAMISSGSLSRASSLLTTEGLLHRVEECGYLLVPEAVGAAVGDEAGGGVRDLIEDDQVVLAEGRPGGAEVHDALGEADERGELDGAVELDDLRLAAQSLEVASGGVGKLGRDPHHLGVRDGPEYLLRPLLGGGQDHPARAGSEVPELHDVRPLLLEYVLADYPDVRRPVLDEDRHVRGTAHDELGLLAPVEEPASVVPQHLHRQPRPTERHEGIFEDRTLRYRHPQPAQGRTLPATASHGISSNSPPGSAGASLRPSGAG